MAKRTAKKSIVPVVRNRTARFRVSFTVEVEIPDESASGNGWLVSDAVCDVENAATALVDAAPSRPFHHEGVTITDTVDFGCEFVEELEEFEERFDDSGRAPSKRSRKTKED